MRQSIPYSQQQQQNRTYHHHHDASTAGRNFHYARHQYRNVNGYYTNHSNHHYQLSQLPRPIPTYPTTFSWVPPGKRKFEASESENSTKTRPKVEKEPRQEDPKPETNVQSSHTDQKLASNIQSCRTGYQTSYQAYERNNHQKRQYGLLQNHGFASSRANHDSKHQGSLLRSSTNQYYPNENTPPATATSENSTSTEQDLSCKGCLSGRDVLHLKLFHAVLTQAIYSNVLEPTDIVARQIPGCALVHEGLCFGFEKDPANGTKLLVVRGTGCLGMALSNRSKCQVCERQQSNVDQMMQNVVAQHSESPQTICQKTSINDIKMVPTLAEAKMRQMECEIQDYKENSITVVNV